MQQLAIKGNGVNNLAIILEDLNAELLFEKAWKAVEDRQLKPVETVQVLIFETYLHKVQSLVSLNLILEHVEQDIVEITIIVAGGRFQKPKEKAKFEKKFIDFIRELVEKQNWEILSKYYRI
ncbi:MAG: hypothetical protein ACXAEU_02455 [Candidatus Hodarchaeales archaeon]